MLLCKKIVLGMGKKVHHLDYRVNKIILRLLNLTQVMLKEGYYARSETTLHKIILLVRGSANLISTNKNTRHTKS